jgi:N-acetylneuraminic acid mutarotase
MRHLNIIIAAIILFLVSNCEKEAVIRSKSYPFLLTVPPIPGNDGTEFLADITDLGQQDILKYGFVWSNKPNPTIQNNCKLFEDKPTKGIYSYKVQSGLAKGETYYVRAYIRTTQHDIYGNEKSFISLGSLSPILHSVSPNKGYANTKVVIEGKNFGTNIHDITVKFGDVLAEIDSVTDTFISVKSPLIKEDKTVSITVEVADMTAESEDTYKVFFAWKYMSDYPGLGNHSASYFSLNGKGYMIGGLEYDSNAYTNGPVTQNFWEFDPSRNSWTLKNPFSLTVENNITCVVNNKGYLLSDNTFYKYDEQNDSWEYETTFPGNCRRLSCFVLDDDIFIGTGINVNNNYSSDFYKYNVNTKVWSKVAPFPGPPRNDARSFSLNGKGYIALGKRNDSPWWNNSQCNFYADIWAYDKASDTWEQKNDFPGEGRAYALSFVLHSKAYIGMGSVEESYKGFPDIWEYNSILDEWTKMDSYIGGGAWSNVVFTINDKAYVGAGARSYGGGSSWSIWRSYKDFWEFDPNKQ